MSKKIPFPPFRITGMENYTSSPHWQQRRKRYQPDFQTTVACNVSFGMTEGGAAAQNVCERGWFSRVEVFQHMDTHEG